MTETQEYKELEALYEKAWAEGFWIKEFGKGACHMAGAGFVADLELMERLSGEEVDTDSLTLGDCVEMSFPGTGATRIEACQAALQQARESGKTNLLKARKEAAS